MSQGNKGFNLYYTIALPCYREKVKIFLQKIQTVVRSAMKSSVTRVGFRFVAVFVLGLVFQGASAMHALNHEDQVGEKNPLRLDKRSVSTNATTKIPDILKRLQALEEK